METILKTIFVGIGATLLVDLWGIIQGIFKIKSLDYRFVGRWIAYFPKGKFYHKDILKSRPMRFELILGWTIHYMIGISFAFLLILVYGKEWLEEPTLYPAILTGLLTVIAPLFIMQPALGFGIASSNLPGPNIRRLKSLVTHTVYGGGLYLSALVVKLF